MNFGGYIFESLVSCQMSSYNISRISLVCILKQIRRKSMEMHINASV